MKSLVSVPDERILHLGTDWSLDVPEEMLRRGSASHCKDPEYVS